MPATAETADQPLPGRATVAARREGGRPGPGRPWTGRPWTGRPRIWGYAAPISKLLVSLGLLALVAQSVDLPAVGGLLLDLPLRAGLATIACMLGVTLVLALRWWLILRALGTPLPLGRTVGLMFIGTFFTQVLPTSVGGDAVRLWQIHRQGVPFARAFSGVALERVSGLLALVLMVAAGVLWLGQAVDPALGLLLLAALPVLLAGLALLCLLDRLPAGLRRRLEGAPLLGPLLQRITGLLDTLAADSRRVLLSPSLSLGLLLLSTAAQVCSVLAVLALAHGLGLDLGWAEALAAVPAVILITFIPFSIAGWGVREGASVVMLGAVGIGAGPALAISVLFGLAMLVAALPGSLLWLRGGRRPPPVEAS